jgi:hypothetical protein
MSAVGPTLPTWASTLCGSYLRTSCRAANVVGKAERDPNPTSIAERPYSNWETPTGCANELISMPRHADQWLSQEPMNSCDPRYERLLGWS